MARIWRGLWAAIVVAIMSTFVTGVGPASAATAQGGVVSAQPGASTPYVLDNRVLDMAQVGDRIVVVGDFTAVRDSPANGSGAWDQPYVFAFDARTGAIDRAFAPALNGMVQAVEAGPEGTVYLGGTFATVNGATGTRNLVQVSLASGARVDGFRPAGINGAVTDLVLAGGRLYVGGYFNAIGGVPHGGLATLDPATGATDEYLGVDVAVNHNWPSGASRGSVGVKDLAVSPDGTRLVAIGNFKIADGLPRDQAVAVLLQDQGATVDPGWRTRRYEPACAKDYMDSYVREVDFAPDGSYFVVVTTGGEYSGTLCDTAARWDVGTTGDDVQPAWVAETGGDTLHSTAVTGAAVYVGGHQRWLNNPHGSDQALAGAVPRPGIAALDPRTGLPLSWNPGRHPRGIGAESLLATDTGLYVGSDTEFFGAREHYRPRLGWFPLAGGAALPLEDTGALPGNVYLGGSVSMLGLQVTNDLRSRSFDGTTAGPDRSMPTGGLDWRSVKGSFLVDGSLYYGASSGGSFSLFRRSFDGTTFGPATQVDPYFDPVWSSVDSGSGTTFQGARPSFYSELSSVTAMAYQGGRLYYTRTNSSQLFYRYFSPDSGVVSETRFSAAGSGFSSVSGLLVDGDQLYVASSSNGELRRTAFTGGVPGGEATVVSGPSRDGADWRVKALFLGPTPNQAPVAAIATDCLGLACALDASGSTDADGTVVEHRWDFGDGTSGTGVAPAKTYAEAGTYTVTLTVTDDDGATGSAAQQLVVAPAEEPGIAFVDAAATTARPVRAASVTVPAAVEAGNGLVLVLSTNSAAAGTAPEGWTQVGAQSAGTGMNTQVFTRVAASGDAGSTVTVSLPEWSAVSLQVLAYSGTAASGPVATVVGAANLGGTSHTTPTAMAAEGQTVLSVWSDKGPSARQFTAPQSVTERSNLAGGGRGDVATLVADSGAPVPAGPVGGVTATVPTSSSRATMLTLLLQPASGTANQAPAAVISSSCAELTCSFDAAESTDPDGGPLSYAWDFGDGATSTEAAPVHTYAAAGEYTVALTVTDAQGAADGGTATVTVTAAPVGTGIGLRGSAGVAARPVTAASVDVPDSVRAGDGLVLVLSTNSAATGTAPEGWTPAGGQAAGTAMTTQVFTRVATASDAGSTVEVSVGTWSALTLQLMAYSGTAVSGPVASVTGAADGAGLTAHTTPVAEAAAGSWVLSIWSDKGPEGRQFTPPAELSERSNIAGAGNGDVATLVADSGAPVGGGPVGGLTATVSAPSSRAVMLTVVLAADEVAPPAEPVDPADPGDPAEPVGSAPEAVLTSTCAGLTCEFDGSASSDADGPVTSWAWDLGDGTTATGPVVEHAYAAAGDYLVSLTVTDASGGIGTAEATVTVAPAPVGAGIGLRGSAGVAARPVTEVAVEVPAAVRPGDGLVLVLSTNSAVTGTPPAGWALSGQQADATAMTTQVFSRVAAAGDAGSVVTVSLGGTSSAVTLQLLAYSGTAATGPVASVAGAAGGWSPGTAHTTPVAEAAAGSWVLSIWSDKGPEGRQFTPPAELSERSNIAGAGNGDVATLVADSGAPVGGGPVGGLTATVSAPSSRAVMLTVVLAPAV
ncbi:MULTISPECIES: PKD domain-containing protein [unclassified Blastococcus]